MTDNITLPREVVQEALEALELEATSPPLETTAAAMAALRQYLAAPSEDIEVLTATRDRQAAMLRRLEDRETELDAEIGHLRRENERLREELRQSSIDHTRAEVERLREALEKMVAVYSGQVQNDGGYSVLDSVRPLITDQAALWREEA